MAQSFEGASAWGQLSELTLYALSRRVFKIRTKTVENPHLVF